MKNLNKFTHGNVYVTAKNTNDRLSLKEPILFSSNQQIDSNFPTLIIDPEKCFQTIEGFGGSFTDASAETFFKLPGEKQQEILAGYFSTDKGIGYTLCKTHINSCDFSSESYSCDDVDGDMLLIHFSIQRDLACRIPFIKAALETAPDGIKIFVTPWSPPAWMKTNNNMLHGGKLKPECYPAWAKFLVKFIQDYEKTGIPIWGLTLQNESMAVQIWESCIFTAEEERDFVRDFLGPTLHGMGLSRIKLYVWDHNRGILYQRAKVVYDDPKAAQYINGIGYHWYYGEQFDNLRLVHDAYPDKDLLFTEGCVFPFDWNRIYDWHWGERYAKSMIMDLNNWSVGWVDWNLLLDESGGPNHAANFCYAPVIADTRSGELHYMNSYFYIGHFSKFVRPGARRIICSSSYDNLKSTAFINSDGRIVVVVLNVQDENIDFHLYLDGKIGEAKSPAHSIMTIIVPDQSE
jgi:glucosylceramidase